MIYGEPDDSLVDDYPPGHPAGTDEIVSVETILSGRGMDTGGVLGTRRRVGEATSDPDDVVTAGSVTNGPTVLIAVDGASISERVVTTAHRLFGEHAVYLAINVGPGPDTEMSWADVWPIAGASRWTERIGVDSAPRELVEAAVARASGEAATLARNGGLAQATALGDVGDATTAIVRAAHQHHADVVVIGADTRGWLSHLASGSVERHLLEKADFAVLVVDAPK